MPAQTGLWRTFRVFVEVQNQCSCWAGAVPAEEPLPRQNPRIRVEQGSDISHISALCRFFLGAAPWAGFGLCPCSDHTVPVVSSCFLLLQELGWSPWCDSAWYNFLGKSMQRAMRVLDPLDLFPFLGSVQARPCLCVARSCLDPSANNNSWVL